jgi:hypothetical protein
MPGAEGVKIELAIKVKPFQFFDPGAIARARAADQKARLVLS